MKAPACFKEAKGDLDFGNTSLTNIVFLINRVLIVCKAFDGLH